MVIYRITITDENWKEVRENIEENLKEQVEANEKIKNSRFVKFLNKHFEKIFGLPFTIEMAWKWESDRVLIHSIFSTAMLKEEVYDNAEKKLLEWGKLRIERLDEKGNVVKVLSNG